MAVSTLMVVVILVNSIINVTAFKPLLPNFISLNIEILQLRQGKIQKVLGALVIASSMVNNPMIVEPVYAQQDRYNNKLNAPTAIGTRVNSDAESLLRYGKHLSMHL